MDRPPIFIELDENSYYIHNPPENATQILDAWCQEKERREDDEDDNGVDDEDAIAFMTQRGLDVRELIVKEVHEFKHCDHVLNFNNIRPLTGRKREANPRSILIGCTNCGSTAICEVNIFTARWE